MITLSRANSLLNVDSGNPVVREHPLNKGMVGWWLGLPGLIGGNTVRDLGGKWHGTYFTTTTSRPQWAGASRPGGHAATLIDGSNDQGIALPTGLSGAFPISEGTFAVWVKQLPTAGGYPQAGLAYLGPPYETTLYGSPGGSYFSPFETGIRPISGVAISNLTSWRHIAVTSRPGTGNYRLLVDGKLHTSGDQNTFGIPSDPTFGSCGPYNVGTLCGWADDWRLWNRALSDDEIAAVYSESLAGYPTMLRRKPLFWSAANSQAYTFDPSGGLAFGGSASASKASVHAPAGGAAFGGSIAPAAKFSPSPAGGSRFGGVVVPQAAFHPFPGGGIDLGGAAEVVGLGPVPVSGGWRFGGSSFPTAAYTFGPSGGLRFGGLGGFVPLGPATLREAVRAKLASIPTLADKVGDRVHFWALPQAKAYPAVTYYQSGRNTDANLSGPDDISTTSFRVSLWSRSALEASQMAEAARDSLLTWRGPEGLIRILGVFNVTEADLPEYPRNGTDSPTYQIVLSFDVIHRSS